MQNILKKSGRPADGVGRVDEGSQINLPSAKKYKTILNTPSDAEHAER